MTENLSEFCLAEKDSSLLARVLVFAVIIIAGAWIYSSSSGAGDARKNVTQDFSAEAAALADLVLPPEGVVLPARWGDLGARLLDLGVIEKEKFLAIYANRGGLDKNELNLLEENDNGNLEINERNAGVILNLLWALGLGNKNPILESGPMSDKKYGGAGGFASTGGWALSAGDSMNHYSRHPLLVLTTEQQILVEKVAANIYRSCCGNSAHFPDCNHGMAMLGLLQLMASQGAPGDEMYKAALAVNSYWFPDTYIVIATLMRDRGIEWANADPQDLLGNNYSSILGYKRVLEQIAPRGLRAGGTCAV